MVDSIGSNGHIPKFQSSSSVQKQADRNKVEQASSNVSSSDDVAISDEALSLSAAQNIAQDTRLQIESNSNLTLSSDIDRLNSLA